MKKIIALCLLVAASAMSLAAKEDLGKLFGEAMKQPRAVGQFFCFDNKKGKIINSKDLYDYCQSKGYLTDKEKNTTRNVQRFGDIVEVVDKFYFLPESEFINYYFELATNSQSKTLIDAGDANVISPTSQYIITKVYNVKWQGRCKDGMIDGAGKGISEISKGNYLIIIGSFDKGWPVGSCTTMLIHKDSDKTQSFSYRQDAFHDGMAAVSINDKYGFINQSGVFAIQPQYSRVLSPFADGKASVKRNNGEEIIIDKSGSFIDYTEAQKTIIAREEAEKERRLAEQRAEAERAEAERQAGERRNGDVWNLGRSITSYFERNYDGELSSVDYGEGEYDCIITGCNCSLYTPSMENIKSGASFYDIGFPDDGSITYYYKYRGLRIRINFDGEYRDGSKYYIWIDRKAPASSNGSKKRSNKQPARKKSGSGKSSNSGSSKKSSGGLN